MFHAAKIPINLKIAALLALFIRALFQSIKLRAPRAMVRAEPKKPPVTPFLLRPREPLYAFPAPVIPSGARA